MERIHSLVKSSQEGAFQTPLLAVNGRCLQRIRQALFWFTPLLSLCTPYTNHAILGSFIAGGLVNHLWRVQEADGVAGDTDEVSTPAKMYESYFKPLSEYVLIPFFFVSSRLLTQDLRATVYHPPLTQPKHTDQHRLQLASQSPLPPCSQPPLSGVGSFTPSS